MYHFERKVQVLPHYLGLEFYSSSCVNFFIVTARLRTQNGVGF